MSHCYICNGKLEHAFSHKILFKHTINYFLCSGCQLLQTESPYWLDEAYKEPINDSDTGLVSRNLRIQKLLYLVIKCYLKTTHPWVDMGGGYGLLTRLMRDLGVDFYWDDLYTDNLFAKGFESHHLKKGSEVSVSSFELFEHSHDIISLIDTWNTNFSVQNIVFSTLTTPQPIPSKDWWYYGFDHGQHISFYSEASLQHIASRLNFYYIKLFNNFHIFTKIKPKPFRLYLIRSKLREFLFFYYKNKSIPLTEQDSWMIKSSSPT